VKIYVAAVEMQLRKNERKGQNKDETQFSTKNGNWSEIGTDEESLCSSQRYGIMIPQKLSNEMDPLDRHAIASRDRKETRKSANFGIR